MQSTAETTLLAVLKRTMEALDNEESALRANSLHAIEPLIVRKGQCLIELCRVANFELSAIERARLAPPLRHLRARLVSNRALLASHRRAVSHVASLLIDAVNEGDGTYAPKGQPSGAP